MGNCSSCCAAVEPLTNGQIEYSKVYMPGGDLAQVEAVVRDTVKKRSELRYIWANCDGNNLASLARDIKMQLDERLGLDWMVVVGDFGYEGAHKEDHFVSFYLDGQLFLVAKVI